MIGLQEGQCTKSLAQTTTGYSIFKSFISSLKVNGKSVNVAGK